jgi:hypothetical protein
MPKKKKNIDPDSISSELKSNFSNLLSEEIGLIRKDTDLDLIVYELAFWRLFNKLGKWRKRKGGDMTAAPLLAEKAKAYSYLRPIYQEIYEETGKYPSAETLQKALSRMNLEPGIFSTDKDEKALIKPSTLRSFVRDMKDERSKLPSTNS